MAKTLYNTMTNNRTTEPQQIDVNAVSRISEGTSVQGELSSLTDIRVDGSVNGKMFSAGRIVVGEKAVIEGSVFCSDLDLWGSVKGDVYVKNLLSLKSPASVEGNLHVRRLQVEMGASLNGTCKMISEEEFDKAASQLASEPVKVENLG
ncbi:MAG: polymer-forming cytoskeletal protein [Bacteroidales bacterium]|nr:polymer-forming cytoskeletal protein [Bacteroidales bacterium]